MSNKSPITNPTNRARVEKPIKYPDGKDSPSHRAFVRVFPENGVKTEGRIKVLYIGGKVVGSMSVQEPPTAHLNICPFSGAKRRRIFRIQGKIKKSDLKQSERIFGENLKIE